jgi:two-component system OmpR family sensor kinase
VSLKTRLIFVLLVVLTVALFLVGFVTYSLMKNYFYSQADHQLEEAAEPIAQILDVRGSITEQELARIAPGMYVAITNSEGQILYQLVEAYGPGGQIQYAPVVPKSVYLAIFKNHEHYVFITVSDSTAGFAYRVMLLPVLNGYFLVLGLSLSSVDTTLHRLFFVIGAVIVLALLITALSGYFLLNLGLLPLTKLIATTKEIRQGNFSKRASLKHKRGEIFRLATAFNEMLDVLERFIKDREKFNLELQKAQEKTKQFLADASHELRSPLQSLLAYSELLQTRRLNEFDFKRATDGIQKEAQRMKDLIEDLFLLARLDEHPKLEMSLIELSVIVKEAAQISADTAKKWPVNIVHLEPVLIQGNSNQIRRVLDNLINNVRVHNPDGTTCYISLKTENGYGVLKVSDDGVGFNPEDLDKIFERFYRSSKGRSRKEGGYGLGLAIVYQIIKLHKGSVMAYNGGLGKGATVEIRLKLAEILTK